jgi:hypothetical protein
VGSVDPHVPLAPHAFQIPRTVARSVGRSIAEARSRGTQFGRHTDRKLTNSRLHTYSSGSLRTPTADGPLEERRKKKTMLGLGVGVQPKFESNSRPSASGYLFILMAVITVLSGLGLTWHSLLSELGSWSSLGLTEHTPLALIEQSRPVVSPRPGCLYCV